MNRRREQEGEDEDNDDEDDEKKEGKEMRGCHWGIIGQLCGSGWQASRIFAGRGYRRGGDPGLLVELSS